MGKYLHLILMSEKALHRAANPKLITHCPSMDLVALVTTDEQVFIYRMNGQRVYGPSHKSGDLRVECVRWKPNGQLLAIAWSDGSIRLVGAESSKIVHQFTTLEASTGITCVGWATNFTNRTSSSINVHQGVTAWEDLCGKNGDSADQTPSLDLPRDLSLIDIESSLPKLSILASAGNLDDVFCSRTSLDVLFHPFDPKDNDSVDVMVTGTSEGNIHLSIYDSFVIGCFKSPIATADCPSQLILHAADKQSSTHTLLMNLAKSDSLFFVPMDLRFISASSEYLSLLASRSTALHNLLRYIHQVQLLMLAEWKATRDLPNRFIRSINETLGEKDGCEIVQALYHSVATGHTFPPVREWLVDELSERGHKRWDKAVTTGLENLRRLVHENMLPALERCSVILSRFAGIARFRGPNDAAGFSIQQISLMVDTVACIHLVCTKILVQVVDELELFISFSAWLRYEIDRLASSSSSVPDESAEKEATIDHSKVMLYLQKIMTTNPLLVFFEDSSMEGEPEWNERGVPLFDLLNRQLEKQERQLPYMKSIPRVDLLCSYLSRQANAVFAQIAEAEKRNVLFGRPQDIGTPKINGPIDVKMNTVDNNICRTHIVYIPKDMLNSICVVRITLSVERGISSLKSKDCSSISLTAGEIRDMKFLDDQVLLVLWKSNTGKTYILSIPYNDSNPVASAAFSEFVMSYTTQTPSTGENHTTTFNEKDINRIFGDDVVSTDSFMPDKIEVRGANDRSKTNEMRRIVLLSEDRMHYKVFKLASLGKVVQTRDDRDEDIPMS